MADFRIQRIPVTIPESQTSVTLTAGVHYSAPADASYAFARLSGTHASGAGSTTSPSSAPEYITATIDNPGNITTSLTVSRFAAKADNVRAELEIVEYVGRLGGDNEIVVREVGTLSIGTDQVTVSTSAVSSVSDPDKVVVFVTGQRTHAGVPNAGLFTAAFDTATKIATFTRGVSTAAAKLSYAIVEFVGSNWADVQRKEHTLTASAVGAEETVALSTAVADASKAFIVAQFRTAATGTDTRARNRTAVARLASTSTVGFQMSGAADLTGQTVAAWVVENTQSTGTPMVVRRYGITNRASTGSTAVDTWTEAITAVADTTQTSLFEVGVFTTSTSNRIDRSTLLATLTDSETITWWRGAGDWGANTRIATVEWPTEAPAVHQPDTPTAQAASSIKANRATAGGSAFNDGSGHTHTATEWQLATDADSGFTNPLAPSVVSSSDLISHVFLNLSSGTDYRYRIRYQCSGGQWSDWSSAVTFTTTTAPTVTPTHPVNASTYSEGAGVPFVCTATDADDGTLSDASVTVSSDIDGTIGTGKSFVSFLSGTDAAPVVHTITWLVTDSSGDTSASSVTAAVGIKPSIVIGGDEMPAYSVRYNSACSVSFRLRAPSTGAFTTPALEEGDVTLSIDDTSPEAVSAASLPTQVTGSNFYSMSVLSSYAAGRRCVITIEDQTDPKEWLDAEVTLLTYGNAAAFYPHELLSVTNGNAHSDVRAFSGYSTVGTENAIGWATGVQAALYGNSPEGVVYKDSAGSSRLTVFQVGSSGRSLVRDLPS